MAVLHHQRTWMAVIPGDLLADPTLTTEAKVLWSLLQLKAGEQLPWDQPGIFNAEELACSAGLSPDQYRAARAELIESGWLEIATEADGTQAMDLTGTWSNREPVAIPELLPPAPPTDPTRRRAPGAGLRKQVMERDGYRCQWPGCGTWLDLTVDHIIPWSKGGLTVLENLRTLCRPHNSSKGARA